MRIIVFFIVLESILSFKQYKELPFSIGKMKSPAIFVLSILLLQFHLDHIESAKILGVFPTMAKSHDIVGKSIMEALVEAGHEVTVVSPFPQNKPIKNWRDINTDKIIAETQGTQL